MNVTYHEYFIGLASVMAQLTKTDIRYFYEDPRLLEQLTTSHGNFNQLARLTGIEKRGLYRWFHDTFYRNLAEPLTDADKAIVYEQTRLIMSRTCSDVISKSEQKAIKQMLSYYYHVNIFTVYLNNCRRTHRRALLRDRHVSFDSAQENRDSSYSSISDDSPRDGPSDFKCNVALSPSFSFIAFDYI